MKNIWIIAESIDNAACLTSGAKALVPDAEVSIFVQADETAAQAAYHYGAKQVYALPLNASTLWEQDYLPALVEKARSEQPSLIVFSTSKRCRDVAAATAALLDAPCISDAKNLTINGHTIGADTMVYGGLAVKTVTTQAPIVLATVSAKSYEAQVPDSSKRGEVIVLAGAQGGYKVAARQPRAAQTSHLADASKVIGVGRGVSEKNDMVIIDNLLQKMGAQIACTRPIAEFYKWLPEEVYIGVSGQVIKPQLYMAVGISGQAQHYYGIRDAKVIVSINKDPEALMNANADYYIVGDFKEVLPVLQAALG